MLLLRKSIKGLSQKDLQKQRKNKRKEIRGKNKMIDRADKRGLNIELYDILLL